jgi:hypothetical protein
MAAVATIVGLGGLTGLALSAGSQKSASIAAKPLIRTKVIRRTIHVTKHVKPKHPVGAGEAPTASRPVLVRQVVKRRVVTTILPTPGRSSVTSSGAVAGSLSSSGHAPVTTSAS